MATGSEIAIVGLAGRFPGAPDVDAYWRLIEAGGVALEPVEELDTDMGPEESRWIRTNCLLPDAELFDARFFGLSPREAELTDPQHRLFLELGWTALEDAGIPVGDRPRPIGVFAGANYTSYFDVQDYGHLLEALPALIGVDKDYLATRLSHRLNLTGPSMTVQSACSTSLVCVHLACQALIAGECDAALAGGVSITAPRGDKHFFMPGGILSRDGYCRAFDADAGGTIFSEGAGVVVLRRLQDALADGDNIHAVILGSAVNNDASEKAGYSAPSIEGQARVIRHACAVAGVSPASIGYVEAHGTATVVGDAVEIAALRRVFEADGATPSSCALGSVKANVGHLASAAGVAGLIKAALALRRGLIPPQANFRTPNPDLLRADCPFFVPTSPASWAGEGPYRAGVSSFGVGGSNAHVILEAPPPARQVPHTRPWRLLPLSAKTESGLEALTAALGDRLEAGAPTDLDALAHSLAIGRTALGQRRVIVARDAAEAAEAARARDVRRTATGVGGVERRKVAFLYPGQGSQYPGMAAPLYGAEPVFRRELDRCLAAIAAHLDDPLADLLLSPGDAAAAAALQQTRLAQPGLFAVEYALTCLLQHWGVEPALVLGHSLGEYAAAWASGVMSLDAASELVVRRGELMQGAEPGAMLAVALTAEVVEANLPNGLDLAAVNAPDMCVVSGPARLIEAAVEDLTARSVFCRRLVTSHAFHSAMMEPILPAFRAAVAGQRLLPPRSPMISNSTGRRLRADQATDPQYWTDHIRRPVLFAAGVEALVAEGVEVTLEVGPGMALSGAVKRAGRFLRTVNAMADSQSPDPDGRVFARALASLWVEGAGVDLDAPYRHDPPPRISAPTTVYDRRPFGFGRPGWDGKAAPRPQDKQPLGDWFFAESWRRHEPSERGAIPPGSRLIFALADCPLADGLAAHWRAQGHDITVVRPGRGFRRLRDGEFEIDPATDEGYRQLQREIAELPFMSLTHLWGLGFDGPRDLLDHDLGMVSLLRILNASPARPVAPAFDILGCGAADVLGGEAVHPHAAALNAFAKVAPQEEASLTCRLLDLPRQLIAVPATPRRVAALLDSAWPAPIGALRGTHLWVQAVHKLDLGPVARPDPAERAAGWLIVGGLGELGLLVAESLAREGETLLLTGRSGLPAKEDWAAQLTEPSSPEALKTRIRAVQSLEALGARVEVVAADASDPDDMRRVRRRFDALGLRNLIYAAGRMALAPVRGAFVDVADLQQHMRAKALGVAVCNEVFADADLQARVLFSSISTVLGGLGHCAYSAANHAADALAAGGSRPWTVIRWDLWRSARVLASHKGAALLRNAIKAEEGVAALGAILRRAAGRQVIVSTADLEGRYETWVRRPAVKTSRAGASPSDAATAAATSDLRGEVEVALGTIWADALGVGEIRRDDDFFDLGGHSLLAVEIAARIRENFGVAVPLEAIFEDRTVRRMAVLVTALQGGESMGPTAMDDRGATSLLAET